ncbi:MAG: Holliday junction resolvase RuvX [Candidatus Kryptoniota bacterium]
MKTNKIGRILGIDYGTKRVGIAVSDPTQLIAQGISTLPNDSALLKRIGDIISQMSVKEVVIGKPLKLNGKSGKSAEAVSSFAQRLRDAFHINVIEWDERFTSVIAHRTQIELGIRKKERRNKENIDKLASQLILQSYLDSPRES